MVSRYDNREIGVNATENYKEILREKGRRQIRQHFTPELHHPDANEIADLDVISEVWGVGSSYSKLAAKHYGNPRNWWVIAWFNQKPTDAHNSQGDVVNVPVPLEAALRALKV